MLWLLVGVVGAALATVVGYRIHLALADRAAAGAARPDSTAVPIASVERAAPSVGATATAAVPAIETATPSPSGPRVDPSEVRAEHERRIAEAERGVQIDLYGEGWCPSCRKARSWLDSNRIPYTYRDTSDAVNKHTMRALNPNSTIPTIDIEGQVLVGFNPAAMRASIRRAAEAHVARARSH
jgi:glutaredoxin